VSLRKEMLQVARLARTPLHDVIDLVVQFVLSQLNTDGGFKNRGGESDLYYTVFGLESLHALMYEIPVAQTLGYLEQFTKLNEMDLIELCCLARCWSNMPEGSFDSLLAKSIGDQFECFRTPDGGYCNQRGGTKGTVYHCFMAVAGYQDCLLEAKQPEDIKKCLDKLQTKDGAYANEVGMTMGTTTSTAAAESLLRHFQWKEESSHIAHWLMARQHNKGGFFALPGAPLPDLLSTATALHALAGLKIPFDLFKENCLDYVDSLWSNRGGFHGNWLDDQLDCEYTYYGLLALGHLSL